MSSSEQLREIITDNPIHSEMAQEDEKAVVGATEKAIDMMRAAYSDQSIICERQLRKNILHASLKDLFLISDIGSNLSNYTSAIRPDGGLIYTLANKNKRFLLGATEGKRQGTNDRRKTEGKKKQAMGNAIERASKNYVELDNYFIGEDIFPYALFVYGCDLEDPSSSIRDRMTGMNKGMPFDTLYVNKVADKNSRLHSIASIFIGLRDIEKISSMIFTMLDISMKYYMKKYPQEFVQ